MGLLMSEDLKQIIPMLEESILLTESILKRNPDDDDLQKLMQSQQDILKEYKKRIDVWIVE